MSTFLSGSFLSQGGSGASALNQNQIVYVGKAGNDGNSGFNIDEPKLTISAAITSAIALLPTAVNPILVSIIDGGIYTDTFTIPAYVMVEGIGSELTGTITLTDSTSKAVYKVGGVIQYSNLEHLLDTVDVKQHLGLSTSTDLLSGGKPSVNTSGVTVDISSGIGVIVDNYSTVARQEKPVITPVTFTAKTAVVPAFLASALASIIGIDITGNVVQRATFPRGGDIRDTIWIGSAVHGDGVNVTSFNSFGLTSTSQVAKTIDDMYHAIGVINLSGNYNSGGSSNLLKLSKSVGEVSFAGINRSADPKNPNTKITPALNEAVFLLTHRDGVGGWNVVATDSLDPTKWDDGTGVLNTVNANNWSIVRIQYSPDANEQVVHYGQNEYNTSTQALDALARGTDSFTINPAVTDVPFVNFLILKGNTTDLTDTSKAIFIQADKFGGAGGQSSSSPTTVTLQSAYNNGAEPEILTNAARGAITLQAGSGTLDTDNLYEGKNLLGNLTFDVTGEGLITSKGIKVDTAATLTEDNYVMTYNDALSTISLEALPSGLSVDPAISDTEIPFWDTANNRLGRDPNFKWVSADKNIDISGVRFGEGAGVNSVVIGAPTISATGGNAVAVGSFTTCQGANAVVIGRSATANATDSLSMGRSTNVASTHTSSVSIGSNSASTTANEIRLGSSLIGHTVSVTNDMIIGGGKGNLNATAIVQIDSTSKGFLLPRMTTLQRDAILAPSTGLSIYNTTTNSEDIFNSTSWVSLITASTTDTLTNKTFDANGTGNSISNIDLTADIIGVLPVANGGTGSGVASTALTNLGGIGAATTDTLTNKTFDANGTGNSISNIDVADLSNGTDGELITWSALGTPTTVATGSAGQILTSNGVGTAPTFQAAVGGGGGKVLQQKFTKITFGLNDLTSTTFVDITGHSITITPLSTTSTIYIQVMTSPFFITSSGRTETIGRIIEGTSNILSYMTQGQVSVLTKIMSTQLATYVNTTTSAKTFKFAANRSFGTMTVRYNTDTVNNTHYMIATEVEN